MHIDLEGNWLSASPKACAVADAWISLKPTPSRGGPNLGCPNGIKIVSLDLADALNALELATRNSPLRKVKP